MHVFAWVVEKSKKKADWSAHGADRNGRDRRGSHAARPVESENLGSVDAAVHIGKIGIFGKAGFSGVFAIDNTNDC